MELRASWEKHYNGLNELFEAKRKIEELTFAIQDDVVIIPLTKSYSLLVSVWIPYNGEYWDKKITEIMGDKNDYSGIMGYEDQTDEEYEADVVRDMFV